MDDARRLRFLLFVALFVAAVAGATRPGRARAGTERAKESSLASKASDTEGNVVYPRELLPLRFDHRRHVKQTGLSCVYCHTNAARSHKSSDRLLPDPTRCDACHGTNHETLEAVESGVDSAKEWSFCHVGHRREDGNIVARVVLPTANLKFDHASHYARGMKCTECHSGVADVAIATRANLPTMRSCLRCHNGPDERGGDRVMASGKCEVCHPAENGKLKTAFASGPLLPPRWLHNAEHGPDWIERHKVVAGADSAFCATCHAEQECMDCHDGRVRPRRVHPNDWISMHPISARQNDPNCSSCHRAQSFCISCHERTGIAATSPLGNAAERGRFHPPASTWTDPPRRAGHHAWEAERNIAACVSCHTERDCALCHGTAARGGRGGLSPHPAGFDATCRAAMSRNARPCLYCHDAEDPVLSRCR
jgi:hypothetical protein